MRNTALSAVTDPSKRTRIPGGFSSHTELDSSPLPPPPFHTPLAAIVADRSPARLGNATTQTLRAMAFLSGLFLGFQLLLLGDWTWPNWYFFVLGHRYAVAAISFSAWGLLLFPRILPRFLGGKRLRAVASGSPRLWTFGRWMVSGLLLLISLDIPVYFMVEAPASVSHGGTPHLRHYD